jgi:amino acid transporter
MTEQIGPLVVARPDDPARSLSRNSVRFLGAMGTSVGIAAPSAGVTFLPALMAAYVGASGPFTFALGIVAMLFVAYAFVLFTREMSSSGSIFAFNGTAVGPSYGFLSAWLLLFVYIAFAGSVYASNANAVINLVHPAGLGGQQWLIAAVGLWLLTIGLTYRSIRVSTLVTFALEGVALVLVAVVAVAVLAKGGAGGHAPLARPFTPHGVGFTALSLGLIFAFTGFSGFEVSSTLGEESRQPRRIIPIAVVSALLVSGLVYVFFAWIETIAYPSVGALVKSADGIPLVTTANAYVGHPFGTVVNIAALFSGLGAQLACVNGASRLLFALARDGLPPGPLARTHPRYHSPVAAIGVVAVLSIVPMLVLGLIHRLALVVFGDLATYGADVVFVAYLLTMVAALVWLLRTRRMTPVRLLLLVAGVAVDGYVIYRSVHPLPVPPVDYYLFGAGATIVLGLLLLAVVPGLRARLASSPLFTVVDRLPDDAAA